jgi:hypothetical protein|tara:strand:+ start:4871 stop:5125 length:255 start_codon:yes stop_codon:yes gene_type:complete
MLPSNPSAFYTCVDQYCCFSVSGIGITFSWKKRNVDAGVKIRRCVDVVYVTVTNYRVREGAAKLILTERKSKGKWAINAILLSA